MTQACHHHKDGLTLAVPAAQCFFAMLPQEVEMKGLIAENVRLKTAIDRQDHELQLADQEIGRQRAGKSEEHPCSPIVHPSDRFLLAAWL